MNIANVTKKVLPLFEEHKNGENVEVEMRLGKFNGNMFDTNVSEETFNRVMSGLRKYNGWESVTEKTYDVFYNNENNVRLTVDQETEDQVQVQKSNIIKEDFKRYKNAPLDLRFSISKETPIEGDFIMDRKRTKNRVSFLRKNLSIDMTISSGDTEDMDSENDTCYQIELEIVEPSLVSTRDELFNIIHKINDLFNLLPNSK
jgi:hypothetical protein